MTYQFTASNTNRQQGMSSEQLNEILEAILDGKYSWACVLMLRFAGHNPMHYIPYRTYNRLQKQHCQQGGQKQGKADSASKRSSLGKITDLAHLEVLDEQSAQVCGGFFKQWFGSRQENLNNSVLN
ncbi:MAG: HetP family heterocyst commitment protein [Symploca sp. SIO3E6]|nr:HetP family heterocyst commitment protein [Caldora sp. SIO3E6]